MVEKLDSVLFLLNKMNKNFFIEQLCIKFIHVDKKTLTAKMPINSSLHQPEGFVNGGYTLILSELVGSCLSYIHIDKKQYQVLGLNISLHHLTSIKDGYIYAKSCFIKKGFFIHRIKIDLYNDINELISYAILTNFVKKKSKISF